MWDVVELSNTSAENGVPLLQKDLNQSQVYKKTGASCCDLQQVAADFDMLTHSANPMEPYIGDATFRMQPSLAVNPISVYPNMIHTAQWRHTSVGGLHPVCRWPGCKIRDLWPEINAPILLFLNSEAAVKASLQRVNSTA